MAYKPNRYSKNISGKYYVDRMCIACDTCVRIAPDFFMMNDFDFESHAYVIKQPENKADEDLCEEALISCPADAIGNDGD